jgi:hypothetical protein
MRRTRHPMASPALAARRDRPAVLRHGRPRRGAPPRSRPAPPPTSPVHGPPRPMPAKSHHLACGQLLPGPVQYHRRRMTRCCQRARCLRRSRRPAGQTRQHPTRSAPPSHRPRTNRPSAHRAGHPRRTQRSAQRSRTRAVWPPPPPRWAQPGRRIRIRIRIRAAGRPGPPPPARLPGRESGLPRRLPSRWPGPRPATCPGIPGPPRWPRSPMRSR